MVDHRESYKVYQRLRVGLHNLAILGKEHFSKGVPIRKFLPNYPYLYATIQSHGYSEDVQTQYGITNEVRNGLSIMVAC